MKKKAEKSGDQTIWEEFKCQRNLVNNSVKAAKREYFSRNIENSKGDLRKTWKLINELSSRQQKTTDIQEVKKGGQSITSASEIAEVFNTHFTNIGESFEFLKNLNNNSLLTSCQSGFRSLHSTLTALLEATDNWSVNIDNGFLNGVIFIDLKKAFDTIDHDIVLRKLRCYGADETALKWFNSYLSNRYQRCQVNGELSGISPINCGVPQGSIIGPLLFLLYINDLPNCLARACPRMYADDTNITVSANNAADLKTMLNDELSNLNLWLRANKLSLNITKTEYMIIGSRQRLRATTENQIIEVCI